MIWSLWSTFYNNKKLVWSTYQVVVFAWNVFGALWSEKEKIVTSINLYYHFPPTSHLPIRSVWLPSHNMTKKCCSLVNCSLSTIIALHLFASVVARWVSSSFTPPMARIFVCLLWILGLSYGACNNSPPPKLLTKEEEKEYNIKAAKASGNMLNLMAHICIVVIIIIYCINSLPKHFGIWII